LDGWNYPQATGTLPDIRGAAKRLAGSRLLTYGVAVGHDHASSSPDMEAIM
jgi:hypothetical protein